MNLFNSVNKEFKEKYVGTNWEWFVDHNSCVPGQVSTVVDVVKKGNVNFVVFDNGEKLNIEVMMQYVNKTNKSPAEGVQPTEKPRTEITINGVKSVSNEPTFSKPFQQPEYKKEGSDLFKMFGSEVREVSIKLNISMPNMNLVKMMYKNASDKDNLISELSRYILKSIDERCVSDAILKIVAPHEKNKMKDGPAKLRQDQTKEGQPDLDIKLSKGL